MRNDEFGLDRWRQRAIFEAADRVETFQRLQSGENGDLTISPSQVPVQSVD